MLAGSRLDQMRDEANPIRISPDAALDHVADVEPLAQLDRVGGRLLQEAAVGRVQPELAEAHEVGDQLLGQPAGKHVVGITFREIREGQDDDRRPALLEHRERGRLERRAFEAQRDRGEQDHASEREPAQPEPTAPWPAGLQQPPSHEGRRRGVDAFRTGMVGEGWRIAALEDLNADRVALASPEVIALQPPVQLARLHADHRAVLRIEGGIPSEHLRPIVYPLRRSARPARLSSTTKRKKPLSRSEATNSALARTRSSSSLTTSGGGVERARTAASSDTAISGHRCRWLERRARPRDR